jgi:peptide/nickel transport system substrate-binding protein
VVAGIVDLQSMNAITSSESLARSFQRNVLLMPLLRYDAELQPSPWLAESWDTVRATPDSLDLTFRLRSDVRWHDGRPTTAEDVKFTFERVVDPEAASSMGPAFARYRSSAQVIDPWTIRFRLRSHAEFLDGWTQLAIMPAHLLGSVPSAELARNPFGTDRPVGNGPFRFVRRTPGQEWVFEANPDFPAALGGRPLLDRLVYRVIPDQTALSTALLTGEVDVYLGVNPAQAEELRRGGRVRILAAPMPALTYVAWNGRLPMFDTPEERRALSMALDRKALAAAVLGPHGEVGRSVVTPAHWSFDAGDSGSVLPYSVQAARELLAGAGWADRDGDGVLEDSAGRPFRFSLAAPAGNQPRIDVTQIVQAQLRPLGIEVSPTVVEGRTLIEQLTGRKNGRGEVERGFEAVVMGWMDGFRKDDSPHFHSRNLDGPFQITSFSHPRVDALLDTLGLIVDREEARPLWREYQRLMAEHAPETVLYYPHRLSGVSPRLQGVEVDVRGDLESVSRWWISPQERGRSAPGGGQ